MLDLTTIGPYAWLIPALTALAFVIATAIVIVHGRGKWAAVTTVTATTISAVIAVLLLAAALRTGGEHLAEDPLVYSIRWLPMGPNSLDFGILLDPLSVVAAAMVAVVCLMIFIYSTAYMEGEYKAYTDPLTGEIDYGVGNARYGRFFAFVALFATGMLGFVLASNLLQALIFWEIMGLCSFLLIGFWYYKKSASAAAIKAFLTTRVGDIFFFTGIMVLYGIFGSVDYKVMLSESGIETINSLGTIPGTGLPVSFIIALLIFGGAVGKSAQFPLHVWLPDAMEGPTPVSALIHAATMVSAGVFLIARMFPIFSAPTINHVGDISTVMMVVALVGSFTAVFAATIGVAQFDIKRVLAYSTISQLGYMVMALGIGAYVAAVFHLIMHAFFKALLFLGSGSVIHGVEHGMHHAEEHPDAPGSDELKLPAPSPDADPHDPQDMRNMGYLRVRMPLTFITFLLGTLALTGVPLFSGFWSKDEILAEAFFKGFHEAYSIAALVWILGTIGAFFTAFYMARQIFMVFTGPPQTEGARHAPESDMRMVGPLLVLAFFAVFLGYVGVSKAIPVIGEVINNPFHHFTGTLTFVEKEFESVPFNIAPMVASVIMVVAGWVLGWWLYGRDPAKARSRDPLLALGPLWTLLNRKYYIDELYGATVIPFVKWLARISATADSIIVDGLVNFTGLFGSWFARLSGWIDTYIVDGIVNLVAVVNKELARLFQMLQTGRVQQYLLVVFFALLFLVGAYVF
jgi:NADH-quinone oxidoreductase subunit L